MEDKRKFWSWFAAMAAAGVVGLVGAIIGSSVIGYLLFSLGLAGVIALLVLAFIRKDFFKGGRTKPLVFGLLIGLLLASGLLLLIIGGGSVSAQMPSMGANGSMPQMSGSGSDNFPQMPEGGNFGSMPQPGDFGASGNNGTTRNSQFGQNSGDTANTANFPSGTMPARSSQGSTILGWILLGGAVIVLAIALWPLLRKKSDLKEGRGSVLLLGLLLGALISASVVLMFASGSSTVPLGMSEQNLPGMAAGISVTSTAEASAAATIAATAAATKTPEPTATATQAEEVRLVVCLDEDYRVGLNVRDYPDESGRRMGTIPAGGCFIINGRSSEHPGWYRLASGQDGFGGIDIYNDDGSTDLWIYAIHIDSSEEMLNTLLDIEVPAQ